MHQSEIARRQFLRLSANAISGLWLAAAVGELASGAVLSCAPPAQAESWRTFSDADGSAPVSIAA